MRKVKVWKNEIVIFLAGALSILLLFSITGAASNNPVGRYQMDIGQRDRTHIVYVIDTATGVVKWADEMGKPFTEMAED
ncbi:MAG: hypothetical protein QNJ17_06150 [Desulfocapsaceae bacterium]|nr:hypothetical protein [Desulfocapsaceae bacterium]